MLSQLTPITNAIAAYVHEYEWPEWTAGDLRTLTVGAVFFLLFLLEARFAYRKHTPASVRQSYFTNLGSFILNDALMSLLAISSLWLVAERCAQYGLLSGISHPVAKSLGAFLLLDLILYGWHRIHHQVDALWMLHKVHHSDRCMNVSTAFRLHGGEIVLTTVVKAAFILLAGIDSAVLLANEAVITLFVMFHHTNITFPGERWLSYVIVVPSLHRTHHSAKRAEHDRNYGAVFSMWDRLFGTLAVREPETLGLQGVPGQNLLELVEFGLIRTLPPQPQALQAMIAEAAYFRAERRGFAAGHEFEDWLEAENEILSASGMLQGCEAHRPLDWKPWPTLLTGRFQNTVRVQVSVLGSKLRNDCAVIRDMLSKVSQGFARCRACAEDSLRLRGMRLPVRNLIRPCVQD